MLFIRKLTREVIENKEKRSFLRLQLELWLKNNQHNETKDAKIFSEKLVNKLHNDLKYINSDAHFERELNYCNTESIFSRMFNSSIMFEEMTDKRLINYVMKSQIENKTKKEIMKQMLSNIDNSQKEINDLYNIFINTKKEKDYLKNIINGKIEIQNLQQIHNSFYPKLSRQNDNISLKQMFDILNTDIKTPANIKQRFKVLSESMFLNREIENFKPLKQLKYILQKSIMEYKEDQLYKNEKFLDNLDRLNNTCIVKNMQKIKINHERQNKLNHRLTLKYKKN